MSKILSFPTVSLDDYNNREESQELILNTELNSLSKDYLTADKSNELEYKNKSDKYKKSNVIIRHIAPPCVYISSIKKKQNMNKMQKNTNKSNVGQQTISFGF